MTVPLDIHSMCPACLMTYVCMGWRSPAGLGLDGKLGVITNWDGLCRNLAQPAGAWRSYYVVDELMMFTSPSYAEHTLWQSIMESQCLVLMFPFQSASANDSRTCLIMATRKPGDFVLRIDSIME